MPQYNFAVWFSRILSGIALTCGLLLFLLNINETISIHSGEIISGEPQADYKAPLEGQLTRLSVQLGQAVKKGDTLMVIANTEYPQQEAKALIEIEYIENKLKSFDQFQSVISQKESVLAQTSSLSAGKFQLDVRQVANDVSSLDQQYSLQQQRLLSAEEKLRADSVLYKKDMLSRYEFNSSKDANLAVKENLNAVLNQRNKQASEKNIALNTYAKEQNALLLNKAQLAENAASVHQSKSDFENQLALAKEGLKKIRLQLKDQTIIAANDGIVNYLYNTKEASNFISKGELLLTVVPATLSFYARLVVPEKDMPYMRNGLGARLKLDAYHQYQAGDITGKVFYVAERKEHNNFYSLVRLAGNSNLHLKPGYSVYGEIIVGSMPLYKFLVTKLFNNPAKD